MIGGQLNQIYQISKLQKIIREANGVTETTNVAGGALATTMAPIGGSTTPIKDTPIFKAKKIIRKPIVETHTLLDDYNLIITTSYLQERELISQVGLIINENDDVRIVKTRTGDIKSAMALHYENGDVHTIRYIDVAEDSAYFKKGLARLATLPNVLSFKDANIDIIRDDIIDGLVIK